MPSQGRVCCPETIGYVPSDVWAALLKSQFYAQRTERSWPAHPRHLCLRRARRSCSRAAAGGTCWPRPTKAGERAAGAKGAGRSALRSRREPVPRHSGRERLCSRLTPTPRATAGSRARRSCLFQTAATSAARRGPSCRGRRRAAARTRRLTAPRRLCTRTAGGTAASCRYTPATGAPRRAAPAGASLRPQGGKCTPAHQRLADCTLTRNPDLHSISSSSGGGIGPSCPHHQVERQGGGRRGQRVIRLPAAAARGRRPRRVHDDLARALAARGL